MSNSNSNASENNSIKISRKRYLNLMDKAMNALMKDLYSPVGALTHPKDRLTWQNINQLKKAIQKFRRPGNATNRVNGNGNNGNFRATNNKRITLSDYGINGTQKGGTIAWNVQKTHPNGRRIEYMTMAVNNNKPVNLNKLNVGLTHSTYVNNRGMIRPRNIAALKIQRAWRATKTKGPLSNPVIKTILTRRITPMLPLKSKKALVAAFRPPSSYNKELREGSKKADPFWRAMLQEIKKRSVLNRGYPGLLTRREYDLIGWSGKKHLEFNPQTGKHFIPVSKRQAAWENIKPKSSKSSKPRSSRVSSRAKSVR